MVLLIYRPVMYGKGDSVLLQVCAHGSPPLSQGEGLGVGLHLIDNQRYYSLLQYPTPGPSPQMGGELHGAAFMANYMHYMFLFDVIFSLCCNQE